MRRYETVFILKSDLGEAQIKESIKRYEGIIASGAGELVEIDEWGSRELAYHIGRERRGYYVRLDYVANDAVMNELERNLKLADNVIRFLSVMVETEADAAKLRGEVEARKRRLAEARSAQAPVAAAAEPRADKAGEGAPQGEHEQPKSENGGETQSQS